MTPEQRLLALRAAFPLNYLESTLSLCHDVRQSTDLAKCQTLVWQLAELATELAQAVRKAVAT